MTLMKTEFVILENRICHFRKSKTHVHRSIEININLNSAVVSWKCHIPTDYPVNGTDLFLNV